MNQGDVMQSVFDGETDAELNAKIQTFINNQAGAGAWEVPPYNGTPPTVAEWRNENVDQLRFWSVSGLDVLLFAMMKRDLGQYLGFSALTAEGWDELTDYAVDYYGAVNRFPLPPAAGLSGFDKTEIAADNLDTAVITGLPDPTDVYVDNAAPVTITTGTYSFATGTPGTYLISVIPGGLTNYTNGFYKITAD